MKHIQNFLVWLVFSPLLIRTSDRHWLVKTVLIIFSPFTFTLLIMLFLTLYYMTVPIYQEFPVNHRFKSSMEISTAIDAKVPSCDTVSAKYCIVGPDYAVYELFDLKKVLGKKEMRYYRAKCKKDSLWDETDSTFVYELSDQGRKLLKDDYEYIKVTIPKYQKRMEVEFGCY